MHFEGFSTDTFAFLTEIAFNNNIEWFNENRKRYEQAVRDPMRLLAAELLPTAHTIDPEFNPSPNAAVSRIRRDTRFTCDKSPFRDHVWLGFRYKNKRISEGPMIYFEITPASYTYGFGLYMGDAAFMEAFRRRVLAEPEGFLKLVKKLEKAGFTLNCESYRRNRFPDADKALQPYLNLKNVGWGKHIQGVSSLLAPSDIKNTLLAEMKLFAPMYELIRSVHASVRTEELE